ncbi:hypothetical protein DNTS_023772 [Danionella cerebrum]|uniref:Doublecortin domain-containing protein n=1 Tax=Danionella cerebrum TaxID=2873325 RepID=A0A553QV51_9TELE|nr:hypothetical protein DNTS_023772 [Danionella translucida]
MNAEKPNFLSQPEVKSIFLYRNGDRFFEPRRLVINARRVASFDALLREATGGVHAHFGAVRSLYTPRGGHRVSALEQVRGGEQYVCAGREGFKKINYLQIGTRRKQETLQNGGLKPLPQGRLNVSARFLKPIREPTTIFIVANGDVQSPALRHLIPRRLIGRFERILEMITERMGLRIMGGVHSLHTLEGLLVMDGAELENGQFYVAVGREKFKKLPYSDLLFSRHTATKRISRSKAASLPPIDKYRRQNGDVGNEASKSEKGSPEEKISSMVREISQARLRNIRKRRSELNEDERRTEEEEKGSEEQLEAAEVTDSFITDWKSTEEETEENDKKETNDKDAKEMKGDISTDSVEEKEEEIKGHKEEKEELKEEEREQQKEHENEELKEEEAEEQNAGEAEEQSSEEAEERKEEEEQKAEEAEEQKEEVEEQNAEEVEEQNAEEAEEQNAEEAEEQNTEEAEEQREEEAEEQKEEEAEEQNAEEGEEQNAEKAEEQKKEEYVEGDGDIGVEGDEPMNETNVEKRNEGIAESEEKNETETTENDGENSQE